jgi:hypothetical protein
MTAALSPIFPCIFRHSDIYISAGIARHLALYVGYDLVITLRLGSSSLVFRFDSRSTFVCTENGSTYLSKDLYFW